MNRVYLFGFYFDFAVLGIEPSAFTLRISLNPFFHYYYSLIHLLVNGGQGLQKLLNCPRRAKTYDLPVSAS